MGLDPVHGHHGVTSECRSGQVNSLATAQYADFLYVHRGIDGSPEHLGVNSELTQNLRLALGAGPSVGPHGGYEDRLGPPVPEDLDDRRHHLGHPGDPSAAHRNSHAATWFHAIFDEAHEIRAERGGDIELPRWGGAGQFAPLQVLDRYRRAVHLTVVSLGNCAGTAATVTQPTLAPTARPRSSGCAAPCPAGHKGNQRPPGRWPG